VHTEELYHNGDDFYAQVFNTIKLAKTSLQLEIHYMDDLRLGKEFFKIVLAALKRGVKVQVIIDGLSPNTLTLQKWLILFKKYGGEIVFFHPVPWRIPCVDGIFKLNKRSHKKVILVDEKTAYLGSFNIDTRQMSRSYGGEGWRDIGIKVEGDIIETIKSGFDDTWNHCLGYKKYNYTGPCVNSIIRLNHHTSWRRIYFDNLVSRITEATERIWITNPYFVPDFRLLDAFKKAAQSGVDVKILVPQKSDLSLFPLINSIFYRDLLKHGVQVYEYTPSILHAKTMIIDDWMMLGSSNLNSRTAKHDWEIDIVLSSEEVKHEFANRFISELPQSVKLSYKSVLDKFRKRSFYFPVIRALKYFL